MHRAGRVDLDHAYYNIIDYPDRISKLHNPRHCAIDTVFGLPDRHEFLAGFVRSKFLLILRVPFR